MPAVAGVPDCGVDVCGVGANAGDAVGGCAVGAADCDAPVVVPSVLSVDCSCSLAHEKNNKEPAQSAVRYSFICVVFVISKVVLIVSK
jgi:hypothetical protein